MNGRAEQYSKMVKDTAELADFFIDQEGGYFILTVVCEILQMLLQAGEPSAAFLMIKTVFQVSGTEFPLKMDQEPDSRAFHAEQFAALLCEILGPE